MTEHDFELDERLRAAARELRRPVRLDPALDHRIMAAVHAAPRPTAVRAGADPAAPPGAPARAWQWLRRPRVLRVTPLAVGGGIAGLAGLAAAAALLLAVGIDGGGADPAGAPPTRTIASLDAPATTGWAPGGAEPGAAALAATEGSGRQVVQFVLVAPAAREVTLVGDFNDWDTHATPLRATASDGLWTVEVPLAPGRHRYAFVVDGEEWRSDPGAPRASGADFGTPSSVVTVAERRS